MATSNNTLAPDAVTDIDGPEVHRHIVPVVNIEEPNESSEEGVPGGEEGNDEPEGDVEHGGVRGGSERSSV